MNIIYGASIVGKIVLQNCKKKNIKIDYFCDESPSKIGTFIDGVEVIHESTIGKVRKTQAHWIIAVIDIKSIVANTLYYCDYETCLNYLEDCDTDDVFTNGVISMCKFTHRAFRETDKLLISNVDLVITEKCSLKCKDCSNLMQYYRKPQDIAIDFLHRAIDRFCDLADEIQEFRIIGGETLMNKNHHLILAKALSKPNINYIVIYTNGTLDIPPSKLPFYQDSRVIVSVTNYGHLSKNLSELLQTLTKNNIKHHVQTFDDWFDCGRIVPYRDTNVYNLCCGKDLLTILYDKVFKCPFSAHGMNLALIPGYKQDFLDLFKINKQELKDFIQHRTPDSCHHCNGRIYGDQTIEPFIQLSK
jgi:sulfatase maturation enzyme AslB (radical SAM superfamily)